MVAQLREYAIIGEHVPIKDFDEADLKKNLLLAAETLHKLLENEYSTVYVSCTAGMGISPAVVVAYLAIFKDMDPDTALSIIQESRPVAEPNMKAIKEVVNELKK